jgi:hypothetical protein
MTLDNVHRVRVQALMGVVDVPSCVCTAALVLQG